MDREISTKSEVTVEEERNNGGGISRRSFLKGAGGIAAAAAVLGLSGLKSKALAQLPASSIPPSVRLSKADLLEAYLRMQRIRKGEMKLKAMYEEAGNSFGKYVPGIRNTCHTSVGEEATCVGVSMALKKDDYIVGTHRSHGYPLAKGLALRPWYAEFFTKITGCNKGHGGTMHIAEPALGIMGMTGIVGSGAPIAMGAAFAAVIKKSGQVAISTCGDGAMNTSGPNTCLNMATIYNAPIVFVINNNQWQSSVPSRVENALMRQGKDLSVRAAGFGLPGVTVDGNDFWAVYKAAKWAIDRARNGQGPTLLECNTYRWFAHSSPKPHNVLGGFYKNPEELAYWMRRDPLKRFERVAVQGELLTKAELAGVAKQVDDEVEDAVQFALASSQPTEEQQFGYARRVFGA